FHAVYWPAFLLSAGLPLPTTVWAHGWWLRDEKKMSKSVGNVLRPDALVARFGPDALRYFLLREMTFGQDSSFSDEAFLTRFNADLANDLGNTVSRVAALCRQSFGGTPDSTAAEEDLVAAYCASEPEWRAAMDDFAFNRALEAVWRFLTRINGYIVAREPWKVRKEEGASPLVGKILYGAAEAVRLAAVMLSPFIPVTARRIFEALGMPGRDPAARDLEWGALPPGLPMPEAAPLFPRADAAEYFGEKENAMPENPPQAPKTAPPPAETTQAVSPSDGQIGIDEFQRMRLVTAKIVAAERVPKSNKLVKMDVDIGTERRQIVAGIGKVYEPGALVG